MSVAPPSKKRLSTSLSAWYSGPSAGIWKLPDVPTPMTGTISPEEGMGRLSMALPDAANAGRAEQARTTADVSRNCRRVLISSPLLLGGLARIRGDPAVQREFPNVGTSAQSQHLYRIPTAQPMLQ